MGNSSQSRETASALAKTSLPIIHHRDCDFATVSAPAVHSGGVGGSGGGGGSIKLQKVLVYLKSRDTHLDPVPSLKHWASAVVLSSNRVVALHL